MFKLLRFLKPYWLQVIILLAAISLQAWGVLQLPSYMAKIVNIGIAGGDKAYILQAGAVMLAWAAASALGALLSSYLSAKIGTAFARDLRNDLYQQILKFSISDINRFSAASLITRTTNDIGQVQNTIILCLSMLIRAPLMCIGAIIEAVRTAPNMVWIIGLSVTILLTLAITILSIVMPKFKLYQKLVDKITLLTRENLTGLRVVRAFNNEKHEEKKFDHTNHELISTDIFIGKVMAFQDPLMTLIFNGTTMLCIWIGIHMMEENIAYLGNMMAFMQYALQVILSFLFLAILFVLIPRANVSAGRINEVLHTRPKVHWLTKTKGSPSKTPSVSFDHISFAYDGAEEEVLHDISFNAAAGTTTAFIGSTGSGKSTLINLIPRFYDPTSGDITVNNLNIKEYSEPDLMQKIGYVPQRGFLFSGDVASNIRFGAPTIDDRSVENAAAIAQAKEFIGNMKDGYSSHISEGGTNVSGGQKQRLSIARAIAKNPDIYIFDDSFSALDMKTDATLRQALKRVTKNSVVLIVAQRINTIKNADQIIVLDKGKLIGRGNHYSLLKKCKVYREIAKSQLSDEEYALELKQAKESV